MKKEASNVKRMTKEEFSEFTGFLADRFESVNPRVARIIRAVLVEGRSEEDAGILVYCTEESVGKLMKSVAVQLGMFNASRGKK